MAQFQTIPSPYGDLAVLWKERAGIPHVVRVLIPLPAQSVAERLLEYPGAVTGNHPQVERLCTQIARFLSGEPIVLPIDLLDPLACSAFQWQVLSTEKSIPRGQVWTYRQLAIAVGSPMGARAVGNALATNPFPIVIPCHRTIRSDGSLGGYQGGLEMKRSLLAMEGVSFDERGRILSQEL